MKTPISIVKLFAFTVVAVLVSAAATAAVQAQNKNVGSGPGRSGTWQKVDGNTLIAKGRRLIVPDKYLVFRVDQNALKDILATAPLEFTSETRDEPIIFELPMPNGRSERFRIEESPMLAPDVAAQFPTWKTFSGQGIDDPTATARFDINANGFHGYVSGPNGTYLVSPYSEFDRDNYVVYYKGDLTAGGAFACRFNGGTAKGAELENAFDDMPMLDLFSNGANLRTLRLAVSATKEYTNFYTGNTTTAFAAIQTTVNRMILIYRRDLAVTFTLVSDTRTVFTDAANGGFPPAADANVATLSLDRNQIVLDSTYGDANYDIGHSLSRTANPNGLASSPSICATGSKAQGFTGSNTPQGDGYDVDYVAHEIGHQFGMSHTFNNNTDGSCSTREPTSAFEPASGVTIMGYGGICAPRNLSANSIEFFHARSLEQSLAEMANQPPPPGGSCGTTLVSGNAPPMVNAGTNFTIPKLTPFTLTGSAVDATNNGLTYSWEEYDLGNPTSSTGDTDTDASGARPVFRSYNPSNVASRTFPSLTYILNNANTPPATYTTLLPTAPTSGSTNGYNCAASETCITGESLPSIARAMNFRLTVRDNFSGGGGVADSTMQVTVVNTPGPFQVTTQNSLAGLVPNAPWQANTAQTVTWDVAGTNAAPINTTNVNILLSTDGGITFPITLIAATPNDGTESITVPNNPTSTARIKVEAVGNIFFDISNANFTITTASAAGVEVSGRVTTRDGRGLRNAVVFLTDSSGTTRRVITSSFGYYRFSGVQAGGTYIVGVTSKQYQFDPRPVVVFGDLADIDFVAQ